MELTFVTRRKFVMEDASSAQQIIVKFPALKMPDIVSTCVHARVHVCMHMTLFGTFYVYMYRQTV